ncbi:sirohydrochlorin chelatase [Streptomyces sp. 8N616]|uniref:sirohydrochlorin chelatase n=1 Tax=Streptomyces sp. 8N616 TaxID=3457414 RepID=UPI003FCF1A45
MTASTPPPGSAPPGTTVHLDSTAQLMTQITAQLSSQLLSAGTRSLRRQDEDGPHEGRSPHEAHQPREGRRPAAPPTLVAVAHGSRDPRALRTVTALLDLVRAMRPGLPVRLGHIELNDPLLADTLAGLRGEAVLVPLLFGRGYHVKQDIPQAVAAAPHLGARIAAPLGPHPLLAEALHSRLSEAGWRTPARGAEDARSGVVLAAAGSLDPESAADTTRTAELLSARLGGVPVLPAYASAAAPTVPEAVSALRARGRDRIAVASYFTAPGRFAVQSAAQAPGIAAAPIGVHPALARLVLHRYDQALAASQGAAPGAISAAAPAAALAVAGEPHLATA